MKKEIVQSRIGYYARYKKWYHIRWRYIGINHTWIHPYGFCASSTYQEAQEKLDYFFPDLYANRQKNKA